MKTITPFVWAFVLFSFLASSISVAIAKPVRSQQACRDLAAQRGFSFSGKDAGVTRSFIRACMQGKQN